MNIVPKFDDILSNEASQFLRRNITNGAYNDVYHYLDVQFRLLREDFLKPLRDGVQKLREIIREARFDTEACSSSNKQKKDQQKDQQDSLLLTNKVKTNICQIESLSVYFDCLLEGPLVTNVGMAYHVRLNADKTKSINWNVAKKLMYGSLVCMSNDYFEKSCLVGSICNRDADLLKQGIVTVKFNFDSDNYESDENGPKQQLAAAALSGRFIMLETSAFFESYKHVLQALVSFRRDGEANFPFRENLVYCQNRTIRMPNYLNLDSYLDLR